MNNKTLILASIMTLVCFSAYADVIIAPSGTLTQTDSPNISATTGASTSTVGNLTTGASTSQGGTGGSSISSTGASTSQGGSSTSAGGMSSSSGNTSGNSTITSNYLAPKIPVASAMAPTNLPTAPCMGSTSVGISAVLFGFSTGSTWEATECMILEMARSFSQAGQLEDAQAVRCSSKYAANAPSCIKLLQQQLATKPVMLNITYIETTDPVTGFKTTIDTRDSFRRRKIAP